MAKRKTIKIVVPVPKKRNPHVDTTRKTGGAIPSKKVYNRKKEKKWNW